MVMDIETATLLLGEGVALLSTLPEYEESQALALGDRLRRSGHDPDLAAAVLSQARLRARAVGKFGPQASRMLFTPDALEQATRREVADHHASRFAEAGLRRVHDLGCGIGADALAMTRTDIEASAVDADEATALLANHNLRTLHPGSSSSARHRRAEDVTPTPGDGVWFDPARRRAGRADAAGRTRRTFRLEEMTPPWEFVLDTSARVPATGAKLSPGLPHAAIPAGAEAEWVSTAGDLVECALWWGPLARYPGRRATVLGRPQAPDASSALDDSATRNTGVPTVVVDERDTEDAPPPGLLAPAPGLLLYEPDLAVHQAGLVGALARAVDGSEISAGMGYVVAETETDVPYARRHRVTEVLPANVKAIKAWLRREGHTGLTIKRRGGPLDPDDLRRRLGVSARGGDQATVLLTVGPHGPVALALRPSPHG